jgi:16S rRNA (guanine(966)-N(2))-methyltransferase RsmD
MAPRGTDVRPSADRLRESLFARLGDLEDARVLDLYAGSGALGLEALSRGAGEVVFVERSAAVLARLRSNVERLGVLAQTRLLRSAAVPALRRLGRAGERFDLVLLDPPYGPRELSDALRALVEAGVLAPGAVVVAEASRRHPPGDVTGLTRRDERVHGDTLLVRYGPAGEGADAS